MGGEPLIEWIEVTIDCGDVGAVAEFWRELLGLVRLEDPLPGWMRAAPSVPGGPGPDVPAGARAEGRQDPRPS